MRLKKALAVLLSLTVLIGLVPIAGLFITGSAAPADVKTAYVAKAAVGTGDGTSAANATANWATALGLIAEADKGVIKVVNATDAASAVILPGTIAATNVGEIVIESNTDANAFVLVPSGFVQVKNNLTLAKMKLGVNGTSFSRDRGFVLDGVNFTAESTVDAGYYKTFEGSADRSKGANIYMAKNGGTGVVSTATIKGGRWQEVHFGGESGDTTLPGGTLIVDGSTVQINKTMLSSGTSGSYPNTVYHKSTYTDNVNIMLRKGWVSPTTITAWQQPVFQNGAAVRVIQNSSLDGGNRHGMATSNNTGAGGTFDPAQVPFYNIAAPAANLDILQFPATGNTFRVIGNRNARLTQTHDYKKTAVTGTPATVDTVNNVFTMTTTGYYAFSQLNTYGSTEAKDVYVDAIAGDNFTGDGTAAKPYATIAAGLAEIDGRTDGTNSLFLKGEFTLPSSLGTAPMVIDSIEESAPATIIFNGGVDVKADLKLANVKALVTPSNTHLKGVVLDGVKFETTEKFQSGWLTSAPTAAASKNNAPVIFMGDDATDTAKNTVVLKGGLFTNISFGGNDTASKMKGADITIDGSSVQVGALYAFSRATGNTATIDGNINIYLKRGSVSAGQAGYIGFGGAATTISDGVVINIIKYSSFGTGANNIAPNKTFASATDATMTKANNAQRFINVPAAVSLTANADGTYAVVAAREIIATKQGETSGTPSVSKVLPALAAGVYNVTLKIETEAKDIYVDSSVAASGSGEKTSPFKTLEEALLDAEGRDSANLFLKGDFTLPATLGETPLTIDSIDESAPATLTVTGGVDVKANLKLANVKVYLDNATNPYKKGFVLDGVTFETTEKFQSGWLASATTANANKNNGPAIFMGDDAADTPKNTVILKGGKFQNVAFGGNDTVSNILGADVIIDGTGVDVGCLYILSRASGDSTKIAGDLNIYLKKGAVSVGQAGYFGVRGNATTIASTVRINVFEYAGFIGPKSNVKYTGDVFKVTTGTPDTVKTATENALRRFALPGTGIELAPNADGTYAVTASREVTATKDGETTGTDSTGKVLPALAAGAYNVAFKADPSAKDFYIDSTVAASGDGSEAAPFKTIEEALSEAAGRVGSTFYLKGEFTLPANLGTTPLLITSTDSDAPATIIFNGTTVVKANLTLDNVKGLVTPNDTHAKGLILDGVAFETTDKFQSGWLTTDTTADSKPSNGPTIYMGDDTAATAKNTIVLKGGYFASITFGGVNVETTINGADVTVDGDKVFVGALYMMSRASSKKTVIADDVIITIKKGSVAAGQTATIGVWGAAASVSEGKKIVIVESLSAQGAKKAGVFKISEATTTDDVVKNFTDALYHLQVPTTIGITYADGKFIATAKREITATSADGATVVDSVNKVLTLTKPGVYAITLKPFTTAADIYVDAVNGNDSNEGTKASPFKTIDEALSFSEGRPNVNIYIKGQVTLPSKLADAPITLKSWDNSNRAEVVIATRVLVKNDLTLDNIKLYNNTKANAHEKAFVLDGVKFTTTENFDSGYALDDDKKEHKRDYGPTIYMGDDTGVTAKNTIVLNSGYFTSITFGGFTAETTIAGADITINSRKMDAIDKNGNPTKVEATQVGGLFVFSRASSKKTTITDDVIIRINSGAVCSGNAGALAVWGGDETSIADGKKFIIYEANGVTGSRGETVWKVSTKTENNNDNSKNAIAAATFYLKTASNVKLEYVDGKFKVDSTKEVTATAYIDDKEVVVNSQNKILTLTKGGTYDVRQLGAAQVYKISFSEYDWTQNYTMYKGQIGVAYGYTPKVGDKITISFDYCTMGPTEMRFGNDWASPSRTPVGTKWTNNEDYWFEVLQEQDEAPHRGSYTWTFTVKPEDATSDDGKARTLRWFWQQAYTGSGDPMFYDFYFWNFKITVNGSPKNIVASDPYIENAANRITWEVDMHPDDILAPTDWEVSGGDEIEINKPTGSTPNKKPGTAKKKAADEAEEESNLVLIICIIAGAVVVLAGVGLGLFFFLKKKKAKATPPTTPPAAE